LRFGVHRGYSPVSENEFVDVETFSDDVLEVQAGPIDFDVATEAGPSQALASKDRASREFTKDLERTVQKVVILLKTHLWLRSVKNFSKVKIPLPQSLVTTKELVRL
jgi:hypothetical protein